MAPVDPSWSLIEVHADQALQKFPNPVDWGGIRVGHIDTGITKHPALGAWVMRDRGVNFMEPGTPPIDPLTGTGILMTPTGTPGAIIQRMQRELDPIVRNPEYQQRLLSFGFTSSDAGTPDSIAEFIRSERELWEKIVRTVGLQRQ